MFTTKPSSGGCKISLWPIHKALIIPNVSATSAPITARRALAGFDFAVGRRQFAGNPKVGKGNESKRHVWGAEMKEKKERTHMRRKKRTEERSGCDRFLLMIPSGQP